MSDPSYAVIEAQGLQLRVSVQEEHILPHLALRPGAEVTFDRVLLVSDGRGVRIGRPTVEGASVRAQVVEEAKGPKITVAKFKRRKKYRRKIGYRDRLTRVRILDIRA
ncbi:MAG TPA: 50S ribosomal protein L21 [Candidatus Eisenbacteria bacterium]|jgi:large subunit ribosomal protein L21